MLEIWTNSSFIFTVILFILMWRVRKKNIKKSEEQNQAKSFKPASILLVRQHHHPSQEQSGVVSLPSFNFSEVKGNLSVGHSLLVQVAAVPPNERGHIVACTKKNETSDDASPPDRQVFGREFEGALLQ